MNIKWINDNSVKMNVHDADLCPWLSFPKLDREIWLMNACSTRLGGTSEGCYSSMNLDFSKSDSLEHVAANYRILARSVGFDPEQLVFTDQQHTDHVIKVSESERGAGFVYPRPWTDVDGLITDTPGVVLTVYGADCVPVFLIDPVNHAIGAVHSGWKGTKKKIAQRAVEMMISSFGSDPGKMIAAIGPSICQNCYEVGPEVAGQFSPDVSFRKENGKYQLDLHAANRLVLQDAGIPLESIELGNVCTCCNPGIFFSHRAHKEFRGLCAGFLSIRA